VSPSRGATQPYEAATAWRERAWQLSEAEMTPNDRDVLLVIDVQNDFVSGSLAIFGAADVVEPINSVARLFDHVIVVTDWHPPGHVSFIGTYPGAAEEGSVEVFYGEQKVRAEHCVQGSWGAELAPGLDLTKAQMIF
jgi:nicotinamidase/pyrazinamidase